MRTPEEIVARIEAQDSMFGWDREVLVYALPFEAAKPYLSSETTKAQWEEGNERRLTDDETTLEQAYRYLTFGIGKVIDHRGISAGRTIDKMTEYLWLAGMDDTLAEFLDAPYPQYGAPQLAVAIEALNWSWDNRSDEDRLMFERMAAGKMCEPDCDIGCGS